MIPFDIKHYINPLHVYCRLRDVGFSKKSACSFCRFYEKNIFNGNGGSRLSKAISYSREVPSKLLKSLRSLSDDAEDRFS